MPIYQQRNEKHDSEQRQTAPPGGEGHEEVFHWLENGRIVDGAVKRIPTGSCYTKRKCMADSCKLCFSNFCSRRECKIKKSYH